MRKFLIVACMVLVGSLAVSAQVKPSVAAQSASKVPSAARAVLPDAFAGWVSDGAPKTVNDAAQLDAANAAALKEYGLVDGVTAVYQRDGETLTLKAYEFPDVSGAYGAFSFYRDAKWPREEIGQGAASNGNRVIFWRGATVVDATFSKLHPESASELRELADGMPQATGNKAMLPPILDLLPKSKKEEDKARYAKGPAGYVLLPGAGLEGLTPRYAVGPASYAAAGGVLPAQLVGFDMDAEVVTANYDMSSGPAVLTLLSYPTPQMAAAQEAKIRAYIQAGVQNQAKAQPPFPQALKDSDQASLEVRRSGQIVALVSGDAIPDESHRLVAMVHSSTDLTKMPMPGMSDVAKTGGLLLNIAYFVLVVGGASVLLGFLLGGGRALYRVWKGKPISSVYEEEFTRLDLH